MYIYAPVRSSCPILLSYLVRVPVMPLEAEDMTYDDLKEPFVNNKIRFLRGTSLNQKSKLFRFFGLAGVETNFFNISWTARPNFRFSGGGGSVCVVFFWARNAILFSKEWTNIIYCILFKETCIKACCTAVSERATAYWRIPFQNNAMFPASNTILLRMAIPCIAVYSRHITIFQRDCCIYERVPFCTTTYCKSHHTQPDSFTRTAVCLEGYFSKRWYILLKGILCVTVYIYIYI